MKVCKNHKKKDCSTCRTGSYASSSTTVDNSPWLYADVSSSYSSYSDSSCSDTSSYSDGGGGSCSSD